MSRLLITTKSGSTESIQKPAAGWKISRKPVHPGEILREDFMTPLGLSANRLATELRVPATRIAEIVNERRAMSADTALRLERYFGMSATFWLNLQKSFELLSERQAHGAEINEEVRPRKTA